jgi:hypothetical protein
MNLLPQTSDFVVSGAQSWKVQPLKPQETCGFSQKMDWVGQRADASVLTAVARRQVSQHVKGHPSGDLGRPLSRL